jgi:hypothetical protein
VAGAAIVVLLILGIGGVGWLRADGGESQPSEVGLSQGDGEPEPAAGEAGAFTPEVAEPTPTADAFPPPVSEPETTTLDPEAVALERLEELAREGLAGVVLDGRPVAQLASKNPGIDDPLQTTADGSHTFQAVDILAEHERLRDDPANGDARVLLLRSDTYGKRQLLNGAPLYVTLALGDFSGAADVRRWCAGRFPELSATARDNQCAVRRLRSPA